MTNLTQDQARAFATEAFLFGYPLAIMDVSRHVFRSSPAPGGGVARPNALTHLRAFPDASFTSVVSPNADTLYSIAWLDLRGGPVVLRVPPSEGRYYLMPMLSAWTDVFASPGTRTTGDDAHTFAIVGPGWEGELPSDAELIRSPTAMSWLIGRTQTNGKADYDAVHRFQDSLELTPPEGWTDATPDRDVDVTTPPPKQVAAMDAYAFFERVVTLMIATRRPRPTGPRSSGSPRSGSAQARSSPTRRSPTCSPGGSVRGWTPLRPPSIGRGSRSTDGRSHADSAPTAPTM